MGERADFYPVSESTTGQFREVASEVRHLDSIKLAGVRIIDRREIMVISEPEASESHVPHPNEVAIMIASPSIVELFRDSILCRLGHESRHGAGRSKTILIAAE